MRIFLFSLSVFLFVFSVPLFAEEKVEEKLFDGWQKPKLLLVFTGFMDGYVEPCGCAGLENMKGGLSRRLTFFNELKKKDWDVFPIDAGNLNKGFGSQEELKYNFVTDESLRKMNYEVTGLGPKELLFPTDTLILYLVDSPGVPRRYTSANVAVMEFNPDFTAPYRVFTKNGIKIGVTSVIADSFLKNVNNADILHKPAAAQLKDIVPKLTAAKCDKKILIAYGATEEINTIAKEYQGQFDFIVPSDTPAEPPLKPNFLGKTMLAEVGEKGKFAVAVGLFDDPKTPFRYERVPFDSRFQNSSEVLAMMKLYQDQLKKTGLAGLGVKPIPDQRTETLGKFNGAKSCADCHEKSYAVWKKSKHGKAWESLVEKSNPARNFDPECIACHTDGWNPKELLPYQHGFASEEKTPNLVNVGCESCHGPGENHIKAEQGADTARQEALRNMIRLPLKNDTAKKHCIGCHDGDNSPHFDFETYWKKIEHREEK
jgi:hypothetical protein